MLRRDPRCFGIEGSRWTLAAIQQVCAWLRTTTPGSLANLLQRLRVSYKRARDHIHSPDPNYLAKAATIATLVAIGRRSDHPNVTLYLDELTYYRQPSLARAYAATGPDQALAERSTQRNTATRLLGALNVADGRLHVCQQTRLSVATFVRFYHELHQAYPDAGTIHVILDNWPVHFHPDLGVALRPQTQHPWPCYRPPSWPTTPSSAAVRRWGHLQLPIQLVPLPTYASWLNPIEKVWRKLKQDLLHLHRHADDLAALRQQVLTYLTAFAAGSQALLRYVGFEYPP